MKLEYVNALNNINNKKGIIVWNKILLQKICDRI